VVKPFVKYLAHDGTFERCVPLVTQRHTLLSRALNLTKIQFVLCAQLRFRRGSGCSLQAPCLNSGLRRWLSRCLCPMRRGHWPDPLPSSCNLGWWCLRFAAGREESQSRVERSADECSAPPPHPSGVPSPFGGYPFSPRRP
jgi:hypothetical protein